MYIKKLTQLHFLQYIKVTHLLIFTVVSRILFFSSGGKGTRREGSRGRTVDGACQSSTEPKKNPLTDPDECCQHLNFYRTLLPKKL